MRQHRTAERAVATTAATILATSLAALAASGASISQDNVGRPEKGSAPKSYAGWKVAHFGYAPGVGAWESPVLDASVARNRVAANFAPKVAQKTPQASGATASATAATGFVCSLGVSNVWLTAGLIKGSTFSTCTGAFRDQYTTQQFKRDAWYGWTNYTNPAFSTTSDDSQETWVWSKGCNFGGDPGGTYNYRQTGRLTATSTETGAVVAGQSIWSNENRRYACGTGIS